MAAARPSADYEAGLDEFLSPKVPSFVSLTPARIRSVITPAAAEADLVCEALGFPRMEASAEVE